MQAKNLNYRKSVFVLTPNNKVPVADEPKGGSNPNTQVITISLPRHRKFV